VKQTVISLLILILCTAFTSIRANTMQEDRLVSADSLSIWEKLDIQCDEKLNELLKQQSEQNKKNGTMSGFRLQIYFGSGENAHSQAIRTKTEFLSSNPDIKTYLIFKSPDFIVRVGNFRTKSEALKMQKTLLYKFPNSFIVADEIALPELSKLTTIN
jgi:SPOR domain